MHRNKVATYLGIIGVILLIVLLFWRLQQEINKNKESTNLIESLEDTIQIWKDKDGLNRSKISTLQTSRAKDFLEIKSKDATIKELQKLVKENKNKLTDGSSVTIIKGDTQFDTVYITKETIKNVIGDASIIDSVNNKWISSKFGFTKDSTIFSLKVRDDYSLIIGEEKQGLFKPSKPFAEVISNNPYSIVDTLRTYQVNDTRPEFDLKSAIYGGSIVGIILLVLNFIR